MGQLAYGAHHDAITGSESDQVYLDLLTSWRDAWELGTTARNSALQLLSTAVDGSVVVWNALAPAHDAATVRLSRPVGAAVRVIDSEGATLPVHVEHGGRSLSWLAREVLVARVAVLIGWFRASTMKNGNPWAATRSPTGATGCWWTP